MTSGWFHPRSTEEDEGGIALHTVLVPELIEMEELFRSLGVFKRIVSREKMYGDNQGFVWLRCSGFW